jgi:hypothetical protein
MKKSPEAIVLTVALVLLALGAAALAYFFPGIADLTGVTTVHASGHSPTATKEEELQAELAPLASPSLWKTPDDHHRLFLSDGFLFYASLYPKGNYLQKDDGTATTPGGVLITWYQKYGLDFTDPNIDREDPDNDGFSNRTEFFNETAPGATSSTGENATNPLDPKSCGWRNSMFCRSTSSSSASSASATRTCSKSRCRTSPSRASPRSRRPATRSTTTAGLSANTHRSPK